MILPSNNARGGFFGTICVKRGAEVAKQEWAKAFQQVMSQLNNGDPENVRDYLDSDFGAMTACLVLQGQTVIRQLEERRARFLRHFEQIRRKSAG